MSRTLPRVVVVFAVLAFSSARVHADPADPLALPRALSENGMADLALTYLDDLAVKVPPPPAEVLAILPLERARARMLLAQETDEVAKKDALIARARVEFEQFLVANKDHPRRAEAQISVARVISAQAKSSLTKAEKLPAAKQAAAKVATRPAFNDAATRFGQAAASYAKKLDEPDLTPAQKKAITNDVFQAELDRAINEFSLYRTYGSAGAAAVQERATAIEKARVLFSQLAARDANHPLCWVAKAWVSQCYREVDKNKEADDEAKLIKDAALKLQAAQAGARQVRFFEVRAAVRGAGDAASFLKAQRLAEQWLSESTGRGGKPVPEVFAVRYYIGLCKEKQAAALIRKDPKDDKKLIIPDAAKDLLRAAEKDFRRVVEPENDYSEQATADRVKLIRLLVGNAEMPPASLRTFDEALMAAQVQMYKALRETEKDEDRPKVMLKAATYYERVGQLPVPADGARDALDAQANLVFAYLMGGEHYKAAVLGDHLARTLKSSAPAARAGFYGVQAYLQAAGKLDPTDGDGRKADADRAGRLAKYVDQTYPTDPNTDAVRISYGWVLKEAGRHAEAFELGARVNSTSPRATAARLLQGSTAYEILRPVPPGGDDKTGLTKVQKADIFRRVVADITAIPDVPTSASPEEAEASVRLGLLLAELQTLDIPAGLPRAEQLANKTAARIDTYLGLEKDDKDELKFRAEHLRLRALYGQALPLYQSGKYAEAVNKIAPALAAAASGGAAVKPGQPEAVAKAAEAVDNFRRKDLLVLALLSRIKEGAVDKVGELLDLMKKLGGSVEASAGALRDMVTTVRPQVKELRDKKKDAEADKLLQGVNQVLDKVASEPNVSPVVLHALGGSLRDLGNYDKAAELLKKVKAPPPADNAKKLTELEGNARTAVNVYRLAQNELILTYADAKKFDEADKILAEVMGTKEKPGWGANLNEFRRTAAYVLEDKAEAATDPKKSEDFWRQAREAWTAMGNDYAPTLRRLAGGKKDAKTALAVLADLRAIPQLPADERVAKLTPDDIKKGLKDTPPPAWVAVLLSEKIKGPDGKDMPNPLAKAYAEELRLTATRMEAKIKPAHFDIIFEQQRCLTRAILSILKGKPDLKEKLTNVAKAMQDVESKNPDLPQSVKDKYIAYRASTPALKEIYDKLPPPDAPPPVVVSTPPTEPNGTEPPTEEPKKVVEKGPTPPSEGSSTSMIIGAVAGVVMLGVMVFVIMASRKRAKAVPQRKFGPGSKPLEFE